jgi:catechol 2,3-dioxygenase-like lactoylglutathione lyase family enzyme
MIRAPKQAPIQAWLLALAITGFAPLWAQAAQRPAITGIAFARFYTTDPPGAQKFYGDTLGFKRLQANGVWTYPVNSSQWIEVLDSPPPKPDVRMAAVAFTTRNAAGLEHYLAAHGIKAELPLKAGVFGVRDPEGNLVIFVQRGSNKLVADAPPSPDATSRRIIHVGFIVRDAAKEDAFWRELLGFRPYWHGGKTDASTDYQSIQVPDGTDWLEYMLNVSPAPTLQQTGVMDHFSLGVAHMADAVAALQKNQCEGANCSKTQIGRDGKVQLNLFDPDHTRVEFMEFTPVREPCCSPFVGTHPGSEENK